MKFNYDALNSKTKKKEQGTIDAADGGAAGRMLHDQGLLPTTITPVVERKFSLLFDGLKGVSLKEKIVFIEDLSVMLKSGIGMSKAMQIITKQNKNAKFRKILLDIAGAIEAGVSMHDAMAKYPKVFSNIFVSMIKVGEVTGNLEKSLNYLAVQLEREADLKSKTKGAMIYPAVIVSAMVIIGIVMAIFVLPKLTSTFKDFGGKLPFTTRLIVAFADFMQGHAIVVIGLLVAGVIGFTMWLRTKAGMRSLDWLLLHFPAIKEIDIKINIARFSRIFSSLLKSGINVVEGLQVSGEALSNSFYQNIINDASSQVKLGKALTEILDAHEHEFPFIVVQMLKVGEETGTLETILEQIAVHYENEVDNTMKNLSSIIEPLLLLVIGGVVAFLALGLISPIYNISQSIQ